MNPRGAGLRREVRRLGRDSVLNGVVASPLVPPRVRWRLLRACGLGAERSFVQARCFFGGRRIRIGDGTFVNYGCFFDAAAPITIGRDVRIGMRCVFVTGSHAIGDHGRRAGVAEARAITIGDGTWIGANVTVLPGVAIGAGAIVAAGSVVTTTVPADTLVAGVPARPVRDLPAGATGDGDG
ncbi:acyltransferase [Curtobacterium luteum]|uniref:acyltransferase n=1 Tax=Curtobacterium luteum TaxID=33881 RepID=UPI003807D8D8